MVKKILVFGMNDNPGGVEKFLLNYFSHIDHSQIEFDFLCNYPKIAYEDELISYGAKIYHIASRSKNPIKYYKELHAFFKNYAKEYDAIWVNINSLANIDYLKLAKKYGIDVRIVHSHNSKNMDSKLRGLLHHYNKRKLSNIATDFWACSNAAAKWFFDDRTIEKSLIIPNAIPVEDTFFDSAGREKIRQKYGIDDNFVLGNVGRLHFQKNHRFMIRVFKKLNDRMPDTRLLLVGQGPDEKKLKKLVEELDLQTKVIFAGVQKDIKAYLSAFDLFFFPSKFEGLGIAALEAQANGLPILASKGVIPDDVKLIDNFEFYELDKIEDEWVEKLINMREQSKRLLSSDVMEAFVTNGYEIQDAGKRLEVKLLEM